MLPGTMEGRGDTTVEGGMVSADEEAVTKEKSVEEDKAVSQDEAVEEVKDKAVAADTVPVFELWGPGPGLRRRFTLSGAGGAVVPRPTLASLAVVPLPTQIAGHGSENDGQRWAGRSSSSSLHLPFTHFPQGPPGARVGVRAETCAGAAGAAGVGDGDAGAGDGDINDGGWWLEGWVGVCGGERVC